VLALLAPERLVEVVESGAQPHAHGWLLAMPVQRLGQVGGRGGGGLGLRYRLKYQLIIHMYPEGTRCPKCHVLMDKWGDHTVQCRIGIGVANTYRDNAVTLVERILSQTLPNIFPQHGCWEVPGTSLGQGWELLGSGWDLVFWEILKK
jgi:hypothetical protein